MTDNNNNLPLTPKMDKVKSPTSYTSRTFKDLDFT